jgi:hypothetical protein
MRQISSRMTFWHKRLFPAFWFGFLALWTSFAAPAIIKGGAPIFILFMPIGMAAFGYFLMRWLVFPLADEVFLDGDDLLVRKNDTEARIPVCQILNVDSSVMVNPERITLTLREPCAFGREIIFSPTYRFHFFSRHPIAEELIARAHGLEVKTER